MANIQLDIFQVPLVSDIANIHTVFPSDGMPDGFTIYAPALLRKGDRGGGPFYYDEGDTTTPSDGGATCIVDGSDRRFMRDTSGEDFLRASYFDIHPSNTGAVNAAHINEAIEFANSFSNVNQFRSTKLMLEQDWRYKIGAQIELMGFTGLLGGPGNSPGAILLQDADFSAIGPMITMPAESVGTQRYTEISNVFIQTTSASTFYGYIELKGTNGARIHNVEGRGGCLREGVKIDDTNNRISMMNCYFKQCLNAEFEPEDVATGALRIAGTDHMVFEVLCQVGDTATGNSYDAGGRKAGIHATGGANRFINCRGELSEIGFIGDRLRQSLVSGCTFDLNQGGAILFKNGCLDTAIRDVISYGNARSSADGVGEHDAVHITADTERGIRVDGVMVSESSSYSGKLMRYGVCMPTRNPDLALYPHASLPGVERADPNYNTVANVAGGQWAAGAIGV